MQFLTVLVFLQGLLFVCGRNGKSPSNVRMRTCNTPVLKNGLVRLRSKGRYARYVCNTGFTLHGTSMSMCTNGRWEGEIPVCVAPGCAVIEAPSNSTLTNVRRGSALKLTCNSRYELVGNEQAFCDGIEWDRKIGTCRETNVTSPLFCDFEGKLKCGWSNYVLNDKDWLHTNMGRHGIGPQHDHTKMTKYEGFFMLLEGETPRFPMPAFLFSPMYDSSISNNSCFKFYYHMYGVTTGTIRVFVKTAKQSYANFFASLKKSALLEITNRSSNAWIEALVRLPKLGDNFQIIIQGELMRGQRTDLAIDDVEILDGAQCEFDKAVVTIKPVDEEGGVLDVQSCENRCNENAMVLISGNVVKCNCTEGCEDSGSCCPDYEQFCIFGDITTEIDRYTTYLPSTTKTTTRNTPSTTHKLSFPTKSKMIPNMPTTKVVPYKPSITTATGYIFERKTVKRKTTTLGTDILYDLFDTTPSYMNDDYKSIELVPKYNYDKVHLTESITQQTGVPSWLIVTGVLFCITIIGTIGGLYVYRERTRVATPAEMKKRYHCKSANEEFSEIRFLTEDEQLDFTMATPVDD